MKLLLALCLAALSAGAQIRAGCTADSMSIAKAGSLSAQEMGRWSCYALNIGTQPVQFSPSAFALGFTELRQVDPNDVADVFNQKQKLSKWAKTARVCEWVGVASGIVIGISGVEVSARLIGAIGAGTYGATKFGEYATNQIPSTANATAGLLPPAGFVMNPGQEMRFKVYASKVHNADHFGPRDSDLRGVFPLPSVKQ